MKRILIFILVISLLVGITGCKEEEEGIQLQEYAQRYFEITDEYEQFMSDEMFLSYFHMVDVVRFSRDYNNKRIEQNLDDVIELLENMKMALDVLGKETNNEHLLILQSEQEYAIDEMIQRYKLAQETSVFTTIQPSQFTLFDESYKLLRDISHSTQVYYQNLFLIAEELASSQVILNEEFLDTANKNRFRFDYYYLLFASQIATYQDYTGLKVNPKRSEFIINDGEIYRVSELDPIVMQAVKEYLLSEIKLMKQLNINNQEAFKERILLFEGKVITYDNYFALRNQFSSDYFVSGDFKEYQVKKIYPYNHRLVYMLVPEIDFDVKSYDELEHYSYDTDSYPEYHFEEMDQAYFDIQRMLYSKDLKYLVFYDYLELEPLKRGGVEIE